MKAVSTAGGGVMFVNDEAPERKPNSISYAEFLEREDAKEKVGVFGKRKILSKGSSADTQVA